MIIGPAKFFRVSADYLLEISDSKQYVSGSSLSGKEKQIICSFRRLSDLQQEKVQAYIQGMLQE